MNPSNSNWLHRSWLTLVDAEGPFLAIPPLRRVWPQGMPPASRTVLDTLRDARPGFEQAWEKQDSRPEDEAALALYHDARDSWVETVLRDVLRWKDNYRPGAHGVEVRSPDHRVTLRPTGAFVRGGESFALVLVTDPVQTLRESLDDGWATSPIDRMEELLRKAGVGIGIVTDGRWWALVSAPKAGLAASGMIDAQTWIEEPQVRDAFFELLSPIRLAGGKVADRLPALFTESVTATEAITEALGTQVRRAVELLVQAFSESAIEARRRGRLNPLPDDPAKVYEAAVTIMMRVVFLLFAEERGLLPDGRVFTEGYGIADRLDELDARLRDEGAEALDATSLTWHRLLATSQTLFRGATFEDLRLPAYGGSLFDPARFPFLSARTEQHTLTITVSDRVMVEVMRAVQVAQIRGEGARRISFRDIDVEQIGYIYEGLLGYSAAAVDEATVGLIGSSRTDPATGHILHTGEEPEVPLAVLERLAAARPDTKSFAKALVAWAKEDQPAAKPPSEATLVKARDAVPEDAERALRAVTNDEALRERLRPFLGLIRRDLRGRPYVVQPGGVHVIETPSRASAGAHYTPRSLAEEVVRHALEPLVYEPGPHTEPDSSIWRLVSPERILDLKVADIACGSGAFLVAAARYLAERLMEAWRNADVATGTSHELHVHALRTVVATCLYGADINAMAVEMCKLSLWLVSLDPKLPFSFVDDKILLGNSLLGVTDPRQLEARNIDPLAEPPATLFEIDVDEVLAKAARLRQQLATEVDDRDPQRSAATKRRQLGDYQRLVAQLTDIADGVIAAGLRFGGKPGKQLHEAYKNLRVALEFAHPAPGEAPDRAILESILTAGLTPTVSTDYPRWKPLHWIIAVPDVMARGGFDAIIGNPPFLGGSKLTGAMGTNIRDWFVHVLADGARGSADLVAYFFLRAITLLTSKGKLGLIATNTLAQGDTREVGLDRIVSSGFTITRSIQSKSWPVSTASLEYAAVWGTRGPIPDSLPRIADDVEVRRISTLLEPAGALDELPRRLLANKNLAFKGCDINGKGFVLEPEEAADWIEADPRNSDVVFPYLNGEDLNSRPDTSPSRWVIDFNDRCEICARRYSLPFERVMEQVKPERARKANAVQKLPWWLYERPRPAMRAAIVNLDAVLVIALVSKTVMPIRVHTRQVFSGKLGVFATDLFTDQAVLSSNMHQLWAIKYGSTMRTDVNYSPTDVFLTFPRPEPTTRLEEAGKALDRERREIMLQQQLGLTKLYNLVNDPEISDASDLAAARMRETHVELDKAVMDAYGWSDLPLDHGFHTYRQMTRWTVSPEARVEILDRLLKENLRRVAEQGAALPPADEHDKDEGGDA
ncbi:DNA methyltransferase [Nonomuraea sp. NPDC052129]|uniref:Eco57I restriction-modification methylase domain-containing protein n=1 Tax=Nonomuraea sp. NPDC052129 TaxID=3154651 RepID=UPI0034372A1F